MIKTTILSICFFLLTVPAFAQLVVDGCPIQAYTKCPGVNLSNANLEGVNLQGAYLKGANLRNTILRNANLIDVYLYGADLTGVDLTGADLSKAIWPDGRVCAFGSIGQCN
ncbi:pentapeptide repeat-containing protein [Desulfonatronovibrio magnus]|uniref:pentapeptide repeat-containing protein n=1 Tax=Desulfonatronovibrio magnus TaxID=698827 RepID=UPI0006988BE4|nr:pentapeptide repeat-containing protein [Desulfonatronovibrio magnus]